MRYTLLWVTQVLNSMISLRIGVRVPAFFFSAIRSRSGTRNLAVAHTRLGTQKPIWIGPALASVRRSAPVLSRRACREGCLGWLSCLSY